MDILNDVMLAPMTWPVQQLFLQSPPLLLPFETNLPLLPTSRHTSFPSIHGYTNNPLNLLQLILLHPTTTQLYQQTPLTQQDPAKVHQGTIIPALLLQVLPSLMYSVTQTFTTMGAYHSVMAYDSDMAQAITAMTDVLRSINTTLTEGARRLNRHESSNQTDPTNTLLSRVVNPVLSHAYSMKEHLTCIDIKGGDISALIPHLTDIKGLNDIKRLNELLKPLGFKIVKLNQYGQVDDDGLFTFHCVVIVWFTFLAVVVVTILLSKAIPALRDAWEKSEEGWNQILAERADAEVAVIKQKLVGERQRLEEKYAGILAAEKREREEQKAKLDNALRVHLDQRAAELEVQIAESEARDAERAQKAQEEAEESKGESGRQERR